MTVIVGPPVGVEKTPMMASEVKDAAVIGEQHQREFNFEDMIRELGDDSFTAKPVKTAISVLASKINIIREVLERMHPGSISLATEEQAEQRRIAQQILYYNCLFINIENHLQMCASFSNVFFTLIWFTIFVFLDWHHFSFTYGISILGGLIGTLLLGTYAHENACYARETRQYKRAVLFGLFDIAFVVAIPLAASAGIIKIKALYSTGQVLQGFSLLDALATVRFIPFFILIFVVSASFSAIALNSKNKTEQKFWTLDRLTKNTIEYERVQAFWMIIHTVGNIPVIAVIPEALSIALMLVALIAVERIAAFALRGIEQHRPSKLVPLICFNSIATIALGVLFALNPFGGPLAIELAVAFTTITNLVLTVTRWREYGKALSAEVNNCPV
uniref:G-protein coupled receptors family 1 profile domain-containing protein n=1 Tax=Ascaris lumbricoides TaxID=6252 RepID=A0A9J2PBC7_ASCLU